MNITVTDNLNTCISCSAETASNVTGIIGSGEGALCEDCAFWCDGNITN